MSGASRPDGDQLDGGQLGGGQPGGVELVGLSAATVVTPDSVLEPGVVWIDESRGKIARVDGPAGTGKATGTGTGADAPAGASRGPTAIGRVVELGERVIAGGFVDLHVHGGGGAQVNGDDPGRVAQSLDEIAVFHAVHGTTSLLATTVSDSPEGLSATLAGVARAAAGDGTTTSERGGARVLGAHLEGPFIAARRAGAQDPTALRPPDPDELQRLAHLAGGTLRLVTLAPELPGADGLLAAVLASGSVAALGHSEADYDTARHAFDSGATHVTHLFNAMTPIHHRSPGLVAAALLHPSVTLELICDLEHVHPAVLELVARLAPGRVVAVSDATAAAGLDEGTHHLGRMEVTVTRSRVSLASQPSVLAGSVLTMERAVRNLVETDALSLADALRAASSVPAGVLGRSRGVPAALGRLEAGAPADLVVLDPSFDVVATIVGGRVVHDPSGVLG